jgi:hypothetical protein
MTQSEPFVSSLTTGPTRFLAEVLENALRMGRRTATDFIRHFPPAAIMEALDAQPAIRSSFLTLLVGVREKTALRTPSGDAGRLLEAALNEGDCDAESVVSVFSPDDRIRYLDAKLVWSFLMEGEFWKVSRSKDSAAHKTAQAHIATMIDRGIAHGLHSHKDVVDGVTIDVYAEKLPRAELAKIIKSALTMGRDNHAYTERDLYGAVPASVLVDHVALPQVMETVVLPMAKKAGYFLSGDDDSPEIPLVNEVSLPAELTA